MAKLNVVIPAVDVMVDGQAYRKVYRKAQAGDIVKALKDGVDIDSGAFYRVTYEGHFADNNGDGRSLSLWQHEVFAPITEPSATITFENATYRKVERSAAEGDVIVFTDEDEIECFLTLGKPYLVTEIDWAGDPQITDDDGDDFDACGCDCDVYEKVTEPSSVSEQHIHNGVTYRKVSRVANVGELVLVIANTMGGNSHGYDIGEVTEIIQEWLPGKYGVQRKGSGKIAPYLATADYVVLEPVTPAEPTRHSAGDYVKVVDSSGDDRAKVGDIAEVTEVLSDGLSYVVTTDGRSYGMFSHRFVLATAEEVSVAQAEAKASAERAEKESQEAEEKRREKLKWAAIGRKVGEFKRGDIVSFERTDGLKGVGTVEDSGTLDGAVGVRMGAKIYDGSAYYSVSFRNGAMASLIVPVEQRFDKTAA
ncbi:hypothetical protein [Paenibacillus sp. FSL K6-2859]|uniref:hypothetical protein n=1 Tax=Paenibacillus sp. FSL K6-2859 TaxID=2921482 RepID=UPI0030F54DB5